MAKEIFNRYEHKYLLGGKTFKRVTEIMEKHMEPDAYNINRRPYTISNIYYHIGGYNNACVTFAGIFCGCNLL